MSINNANCKNCKICNFELNEFIDHTAKCSNCGVLLYYPYPNSEEIDSAFMSEEQGYEWYANSFERKIKGFSDVITFAINSVDQKEYHILDYGGASGQFALIFKSFFPKSKIYITDINDNSLFKEYTSFNNQIKFNEFKDNEKKFDLIFLNDVYEHVEDPVKLLSILRGKLNSNGTIFVDTPRQFWIYPLFRLLNNYIYKKILKGTVSRAHLQIWTNRSFQISLEKSNLKIVKKKYYSELTQDPAYYVKGMSINNKFLKNIILFSTTIFLFTFKNKIFAVLKK